MPYIKFSQRDKFNKHIVELVNNLETMGELSYIIYYLILNFMKKHVISYEIMQNIVGCLECTKSEFIRRNLVPYENEKKIKNGDIIPH